MNGFHYQLKNIRRDSMCLLTFLLPILAGLIINLISGISLQSISETAFAVLKNDLSNEAVTWLQSNGTITQYETIDDLKEAVNNPSTQMIGVLKADSGIQTLLSGDELNIDKTIADTLPSLYANRAEQSSFERMLVPVSKDASGLKSLLIVITLVTAMFMGCTFNAMNIISEKEEGLTLIHLILPITAKSYILQKIFLGFTGSALSALITACICMRIEPTQILQFLFIIFLSAYIAALIGLFIGHFSNGLMVGISCIKAVMIVFLAPPIFFYLTVPKENIWFRLSYLLPSSAAFYGLMDLCNGQAGQIRIMIFILFSHAVLWSVLYTILKSRKPIF